MLAEITPQAALRRRPSAEAGAMFVAWARAAARVELRRLRGKNISQAEILTLISSAPAAKLFARGCI
jgi:hypothetical protein